MNSSIDVRPLEAHEWKLWRLRALADVPDAFRRTLSEERGYVDFFWAEVVARPPHISGGELWIAWIDDSPVGMPFGRVDEGFATAEIGAMWVEAESRRRGVGSALVAVAMVWAKSLDIGAASLWCPDDDDVTTFSSELGFEPTGERDPLKRNSPLMVEDAGAPLASRAASECLRRHVRMRRYLPFPFRVRTG